MYRKRLLHLAQLSAVACTGYFVGQQNSKNNENYVDNEITIDGRPLKNMPGLPIFGTVSAATPYTESGPKDRVSCVIVYP